MFNIKRIFSLLAFYFFVTGTTVLYAQFSPGELARPHSKYEGTENCTQCHDLGKKLSNQKCLDCHKEIRALINAKRGYHSSAEVNGKECRKCHSDHNGRNYKMIKFDAKKFDHKLAGYELKGAHAKLECEKCHTVQFIKNPDLKKRKSTYLGLETKCISCHENKHNPSIGDDCSSCHKEEKFKPVQGFDHNKAKFKLTGAHTKVECEKCHPREPKEVQPGVRMMKFKGIQFNECSSCHKDVHEGRLGKDCEKCHSTQSFKQIKKSEFNHDATKYPLRGKHTAVDCKKCHTSGDMTKRIKFTNCTDCHKDFHKGDFTKDGKITDCNSCHTVNQMAPSLFTIERHNEGGYKLAGAHLSVACEQCHKTSPDWKFRLEKKECIKCHENVHGNSLSAKYLGNNNCTGCHNEVRWTEVHFDHDKTEFRLLGKHTEVKCITCHIDFIGDKKNYKFKLTRNACEECHKDIHLKQFVGPEGATDCKKCHSFEGWPVKNFNHEVTRFPLKGAHEKVPCGKCHKQVEINFQKTIQFKIQDIRCVTCHS